MFYDYSKLKGRIVEIYGSRAAFGEKMGFSESTVSKKLRGMIPFRQAEMSKSMELLGLSENDIPEYFFARKLSLTNENERSK